MENQFAILLCENPCCFYFLASIRNNPSSYRYVSDLLCYCLFLLVVRGHYALFCSGYISGVWRKPKFVTMADDSVVDAILEESVPSSKHTGKTTDRQTPSTSTADGGDVAQLQITVNALAEQMAWFCDKLRRDVVDTPSDAESEGTVNVPPTNNDNVNDPDQAVTALLGLGTAATADAEGGATSGPLAEIEQFYETDTAAAGPEIDPQFARIVATFI